MTCGTGSEKGLSGSLTASQSGRTLRSGCGRLSVSGAERLAGTMAGGEPSPVPRSVESAETLRRRAHRVGRRRPGQAALPHDGHKVGDLGLVLAEAAPATMGADGAVASTAGPAAGTSGAGGDCAREAPGEDSVDEAASPAAASSLGRSARAAAPTAPAVARANDDRVDTTDAPTEGAVLGCSARGATCRARPQRDPWHQRRQPSRRERCPASRGARETGARESRRPSRRARARPCSLRASRWTCRARSPASAAAAPRRRSSRAWTRQPARRCCERPHAHRWQA